MAFANITYSDNISPWKTTGHDISEKFLPVEEVMKRSGMDWNVELKDVFLGDGTKVPKAKATVREDTNEVLGLVGSSYHVLNNIEAFQWFAPFVESKVASISNVGTFYNGKQIFLQAKIENTTTDIINEDPVDAFITLIHSHNGSKSLMVHLGVTRLFCTNQMKLFKDSASSKMLKMKHTKNMKINLDTVQNVIDTVSLDFKATIEQFRKMSAKGICKKDLEKYVKIVFNKKDEDNEESEKVRIVEKIQYIYENGIQMNNIPDSPYKLYSAVSEYLTHHAARTESARLSSLWSGEANKINQIALDTAIQFANGTI